MEWTIVFFFFLFGLVIGSYLNVAIYRLPLASVHSERAQLLPAVSPYLSALDLVPLFSWLGLRGKCRYCHAPISPRYPLIESQPASSMPAAVIFTVRLGSDSALLISIDLSGQWQ
ncbi:MAG: prepilin peptidase [Holdemania massiliensis]